VPVDMAIRVDVRMGAVALTDRWLRARLAGEDRLPFSIVAAVTVSLHGLQVSSRGHRVGGALVFALRTVLPRFEELLVERGVGHGGPLRQDEPYRGEGGGSHQGEVRRERQRGREPEPMTRSQVRTHAAAHEVDHIGWVGAALARRDPDTSQ
jgi:hypothetical protein